MKKFALLLLCGALVVATSARPAQAIPEFKKHWDAHYMETSTNDTFVEAAKEAKCNVCHFGTKKTDRNDYGMALSELLSKDDYKADRVKAEPEAVKKEVLEAFKKVEAAKSVNGATFGELLKAGKLPGTAPSAE